MFFTLLKLNEGFTIEKPNILRPSLKIKILQPLLTTSRPLDITSSGIIAKGKTDYHCKIKETLFIQELEPALNVNVGSEKLMPYLSGLFYFTVRYLLNLGSSLLTFVIL